MYHIYGENCIESLDYMILNPTRCGITVKSVAIAWEAISAVSKKKGSRYHSNASDSINLHRFYKCVTNKLVFRHFARSI